MSLDKFIYIKYGELVLKGKNKKDFINLLFKNISNSLHEFKQIKKIKKHDCIMLKEISDDNVVNILKVLKRTPGISLIILAYETNNDFANINKTILELAKPIFTDKKTTFKVITKRLDKQYVYNSMEISKKIGESVLKNFSTIKVDIKNPDIKINIEILKNKAIIYFDKIKGVGGFPLGINGKGLMLLSGGIDSPVASYLLLKKGIHVDFLTFISPPHTDERVLEKVKKLISILSMENKLYQPKLFVINFTKLQHEISHIENKNYQITIMRRYFFKIAQYIQKKYSYSLIGTGESIGQVASQTIESMSTIQNVLNDTLLIRPLLTYDKNEIIDLAKEIGTYEISILPYEDTCSLFVPNNPVTKPKIHIAKSLEEKLDLLEKLYENTIKDI